MNCPKCGSKMTQLFVSWVCDACNPALQPATNPAVLPNSNCSSGSCSSGCSSGGCSTTQSNSINLNSSIPLNGSVSSYYASLVPPPPSPTDWWLKYWTASISISAPTAKDGLNALMNPRTLFTNKPKMILLVSPDPNDYHWADVKVIDSMALSAIGTIGRTLWTDIRLVEDYFPVFIGPPSTNSNSIDGPNIWIFP